MNIPSADMPDARAAIKSHGNFADWCAEQDPVVDPATATDAQLQSYVQYVSKAYWRNALTHYRRNTAAAGVADVDVT